MTDRLHSCKDSPDGKHKIGCLSRCCIWCHRAAVYLMDIGWNTPLLDPDAHLGAAEWRDEEADINDAPSARFLR